MSRTSRVTLSGRLTPEVVGSGVPEVPTPSRSAHKPLVGHLAADRKEDAIAVIERAEEIRLDSPRFLDARLAWLSNGRCQYEEALAAAEQGSKYPDDLGLATWSVIELIEAAVRSGRREMATMAFHQLSAATLASGSDWALGVLARCRALVSDGNEAEVLYLEAIERLGRTSVGVELARAHLLYGEWLRRVGRRVDARRELRVAYAAFSSMCVEPFAERARRELLATGEIVRKRSVETFDELTPQEDAISRLASSGCTNSEIARTLFISERTVEWHLRKVFTKLGIRSRRQLREMLREANDVSALA
jgi:DNA-binding CsgD family transcriptional regulator